MVNVDAFPSRPQSSHDSATRRGTWELDGGARANQTSQRVDLPDWLTGIPAPRAPRGEAAPETDGRGGLRSVELLVATRHSARDGRRVALPLEH